MKTTARDKARECETVQMSEQQAELLVRLVVQRIARQDGLHQRYGLTPEDLAAIYLHLGRQMAAVVERRRDLGLDSSPANTN